MKNLNGNLLCAVDVETTGLDPLHNCILEIAVIPLNAECRKSKNPKHRILSLKLRPREGAVIDAEALRIQLKDHQHSPNGDPGDQHSQKIHVNSEFITDCITNGIDSDDGLDLFDRWFNDLGLPPKKRIVPLAHNWIFDCQFIREWMGIRSFELYFDPRYRDTLPLSNFMNDMADFRKEPFPFPKNRLSEICSRLNIEMIDRHQALSDALACSDAYRTMMQVAPGSMRLCSVDEVTYKCATCGDTAITKIVNGKPYCAMHIDPGVVELYTADYLPYKPSV